MPKTLKPATFHGRAALMGQRQTRALDDVLRRASGDVALPAVVVDLRNRAAAIGEEIAAVHAAGFHGRTDLAARIAEDPGVDFTDREIYLDVAVYETRLAVLRAAAERAAALYYVTARDHADDILGEFEAVVVRPILDLYSEAAAATTDADDVTSLARRGDAETATLLARALDPALLATLKHADTLRAVLTRDEGDPALPWLSGVPLAALTPEDILARLRSGAVWADYLDPSTVEEIGLADEDDEDDETPRGIMPPPITTYPYGPLAAYPTPRKA